MYKTHLLVTLQWCIDKNFVNTEDAIIIDKVFENEHAAFEEMEKVMPTNYVFDDGDDFGEWYGEDPFTQYSADINGRAYILAVFRPVES